MRLAAASELLLAGRTRGRGPIQKVVPINGLCASQIYGRAMNDRMRLRKLAQDENQMSNRSCTDCLTCDLGKVKLVVRWMLAQVSRAFPREL